MLGMTSQDATAEASCCNRSHVVVTQARKDFRIRLDVEEDARHLPWYRENIVDGSCAFLPD